MDDAGITELAVRARDGDPDAAAAFVRATQQQLWRMLVHLADRRVAEDLAQETYARAFVALAAFRGEASARTWLFAIARRVAADHLRRAGRRPAEVGSETPVDVTPRGGDVAEAVVLREAVAGLADERREAFVLTQVLGLSYREVAAICDCPVGTVRSRVARARADLIGVLDDAERPGDDVVAGDQG